MRCKDKGQKNRSIFEPLVKTDETRWLFSGSPGRLQNMFVSLGAARAFAARKKKKKKNSSRQIKKPRSLMPALQWAGLRRASAALVLPARAGHRRSLPVPSTRKHPVKQ